MHCPSGVEGTGGYPGARAWARDRIDRAVEASIFNHDLVRASSRCGCYWCLAIFPATAVDRWCDGRWIAGLTALCPRCGIDSVLPDAAGLPIEPEFLEALRVHGLAHTTGEAAESEPPRLTGS